MRRIIGLLAVLLGATSVVLLVTGGIAVWRAELVVADRMDRLTTRTSESLGKVEGRLSRMESKAKAIMEDAQSLRMAASSLVGHAVEDVADRSEVDQLLVRLDRLLERSGQLGETLNFEARLFEDFAELSTQLDGNSNRAKRLRRVAETLEQAAEELADIRKEVAESRLQEVDSEPRKLIALCARSHEPLERTLGGIDAIRQHSVEAREVLGHLRQKIHFWLRTGAALLSVVFVWLGLGQACLIGWGWRQWRAGPELKEHESRISEASM